MSSSQRLKELKQDKERIEAQIAELNRLKNLCFQDWKSETNAARRHQLDTQIENYSQEIRDKYNQLDELEKEIRELELKNQDLRTNNHLENPNNQLELNLDEYLCYVDFEQALELFDLIQSQFCTEGDCALFFMEKSLIKRGDLLCKRLEKKLKPKTSYRDHFRYYSIRYTVGNLESLTQQIADFLSIKKESISLDSVIKEISESFQRNSALLIKIDCDIDHEKDVEPLIPWFVNQFWNPLNKKVKEMTEKKKYKGIKIVAVISSNLEIKQRLLIDSLSCYYHNNCSELVRDKLVQIPLANWTQEEIKEWLSEYSHPSLSEDFIEEKAYRLFQESLEGVPRLVCDALEQQWQSLVYPNTAL